MTIRTIYIFAASLLLAVVTACSKSTPGTPERGVSMTENATLLNMWQSDGCTYVTVRDPWNAGHYSGRYCLVPDSVEVPDTDFTIIKVPVKRALVYSSVHASAIEELGAAGTISSVADAQYFKSPAIKRGLATGRITDVGNSMSPSLERILAAEPDVALISPYQNAGHGVLDRTPIVVIEMADYMEPTPKARAEWLLLIGTLTGQLDQAHDIYNKVCHDYDSIYAANRDLADKPTVIFDLPMSGSWPMPAGESYASRLITDAGGINPCNDTKGTGSVQLDYSTVYGKAHDADIWMLRLPGRITLNDVKANNALNTKFKAYKTGRIFQADTREVNIFDDVAFHPERVLADYARIFRGDTTSLRYFHRL